MQSAKWSPRWPGSQQPNLETELAGFFRALEYGRINELIIDRDLASPLETMLA